MNWDTFGSSGKTCIVWSVDLYPNSEIVSHHSNKFSTLHEDLQHSKETSILTSISLNLDYCLLINSMHEQNVIHQMYINYADI